MSDGPWGPHHTASPARGLINYARSAVEIRRDSPSLPGIIYDGYYRTMRINHALPSGQIPSLDLFFFSPRSLTLVRPLYLFCPSPFSSFIQPSPSSSPFLSVSLFSLSPPALSAGRE